MSVWENRLSRTLTVPPARDTDLSFRKFKAAMNSWSFIIASHTLSWHDRHSKSPVEWIMPYQYKLSSIQRLASTLKLNLELDVILTSTHHNALPAGEQTRIWKFLYTLGIFEDPRKLDYFQLWILELILLTFSACYPSGRSQSLYQNASDYYAFLTGGMSLRAWKISNWIQIYSIMALVVCFKYFKPVLSLHLPCSPPLLLLTGANLISRISEYIPTLGCCLSNAYFIHLFILPFCYFFFFPMDQ